MVMTGLSPINSFLSFQKFSENSAYFPEPVYLYSIDVMYVGTRDSLEAILGYVIAKTEEQVYNYLSIEPTLNEHEVCHTWSEQEMSGQMVTIVRRGEEIEVPFKQGLLEVGGEIRLPYLNTDGVCDAKFYGWTQISVLSVSEVTTLVSLGLAIDICEQY